MLGTIVNAGAVILGGIIGIFLKKNMPERVVSIYFQAVGLFTLAIGITMVVKMENILIIVGSIALGSLVGEWFNLEKKTEIFSEYLKIKLKIGNEKFSEGLITAFLLFCIGSMTIVGAVDEGVRGSHELLFTKSFMDFFSALLLASAFGIGVVFSSIPLLIFQGLITIIALLASSFFTPAIIQGLTSVGGILLIGLGINILEIKKIRVMNMLPALLIVVILLWIFV
jgi:uncharacterized membrane protein YqgA involved in biofilm formation